MQENYMEQTGRIFDIQKFSTHDGPGIRTIVFLKGCVLRCRWCCNPESQSTKIEIMNQNGKVKTIGYDTTVREVMEKVAQDMPYYRRSGGGLTLSGGECLVQPEFSAALLRAAKEEYGLSTAVESTACAPYETVQTLLPYLDWYLMDIKHTNPEKHKAFTGRDNALILENAKKLARDAKNLVIRVPVIPTFNDTPEEILSIARFAAFRQPPVTSSIREAVVGRACDSVYAAFSRYSSCVFWESVLHSCAASAMPIAAAVYGPALCVTISAIVCATSPWVLHLTNSVFVGYTRRSRIRTSPESYHAMFSYWSINASP